MNEIQDIVKERIENFEINDIEEERGITITGCLEPMKPMMAGEIGSYYHTLESRVNLCHKHYYLMLL